MCRQQYRHNAQVVYHQRMSDATSGKAEFPNIKTFRPVLTSTSSVYHDMEEAERWLVGGNSLRDGILANVAITHCISIGGS